MTVTRKVGRVLAQDADSFRPGSCWEAAIVGPGRTDGILVVREGGLELVTDEGRETVPWSVVSLIEAHPNSPLISVLTLRSGAQRSLVQNSASDRAEFHRMVPGHLLSQPGTQWSAADGAVSIVGAPVTRSPVRLPEMEPLQAELTFQPPTAAIGALESTDPETVGRYRLLGRLGAGGMGVVYLVEDPDGGRFALKALAGGHRMVAELRKRLAREARSLTVIDSPNVVRVVDVDTEVEVPYIVMTYAEGVGLERAVPQGGLPDWAVLEYGTQLAGALDHVHRRGIVHRDLKPQNVILGPGGVTLVDFGIASLDDEGTTALTRQGTFMGSLAWLAPEIMGGGSADERSDVFGLGLVLGFMAVGRNPFGAGRPEAVMYRIMHGEPDLHGCGPELTAIITRALAKDPSQRATVTRIHGSLETLRNEHGAGDHARRRYDALRVRAEDEAGRNLAELKRRIEDRARMELAEAQRLVEAKRERELLEAQRSVAEQLRMDLQELQRRFAPYAGN